MSFYGVIFYLLAALLIVSTAMAVSRTRLVHAVVYLVISFFATALLFYLLGAPFIAALEVIVYAGAIMVMFLFMIMTLRMEERQTSEGIPFRPWLPVIVLTAISLVLFGALIWVGSGHGVPLEAAMASPLEFGAYIFRNYWFSVEIASFLLFVALVGALYLGRERQTRRDHKMNDSAREAS
jgi:NADH-quinone oxidoreductase subunit J